MPRNCSLQLDVYNPASLSGIPDEDTIAWTVSTDEDHAFPYLLAPRQYASQEIDSIACTASIGQVEIGVLDIPTDPLDQDSGWMTARVFDMLGRRCVLRRYVDATIGWVLIADGPAGAPKMDPSYSAYRWTIRSTREAERTTSAFGSGGVASIVPRGSIYGWGHYTDAEGDHVLLPATMGTPIVGVMSATNIGVPLGIINLAAHFSGGPLIVDDARLVIADDQFNAMASSQVAENAFLAPYADVVWRKVGDVNWNISRPRGTVSYRQPFVGFSEARLDPADADPVRVLNFVTLYSGELGDPDPPAGFPANGDSVEFFIRFRGPASDEFPYYVDGPLGEVLTNFYTGVYSAPQVLTGIAGMIYDPSGFDDVVDVSRVAIRFDAAAFTPLTEHVLLRQTDVVADGRAFTESRLYSPSGWIPALDNAGQISPVNRGRPTVIDTDFTLVNAVVVPTSGWDTGTKIISSIEYNYTRYFIPAADAGFTTTPDGLAVREVSVTYEDGESRKRYGDFPETFDATAFAAIGTDEGLNLPGLTEQADFLAQLARFDVLDRYRAGIQGIGLLVRRAFVPTIRVGDWVPWNLSWLPDRTSGQRGSLVDAAQIVSIRDDNCVWRTLELEESPAEGAFGGEPGYYSDLSVLTDEFEPGYFDGLTETSDTADA